MENSEIAAIFEDIAHLLEIRGENPFRVRSYKRAAEAVSSMTVSAEKLVGEDEKSLEEIPGIGKSIHEKIVEIVRTGDCSLKKELLEKFPDGILDLLKISGVGPKKAALFYEKLGIGNVDDLEKAVNEGRLGDVAGLGEKTEINLKRAIAAYRSIQGSSLRYKLSLAMSSVDKYSKHMLSVKSVKRAEFAGSLRRWKETVGDLDMLVESNDHEAALERFVSYGEVAEVVQRGEKKAAVRLKNRLQVDLRVVDKDEFGAALQYFTGSKSHNVALRDRAKRMGFKINEYGVFSEKTGKKVAGADEKGVYEKVGLCWIEPELREDIGEIAAAEKGKLPKLVDVDDIQGDLHMHTTESDGHNSLEQMAEAAIKRGYSYIAITEHSKAVGIAHGLDETRLRKSLKAIDNLNEKLKKKKAKFFVLKGAEVDIRHDGSLDYEEDALGELDCVVAAVHSSFNMPKAEMTERIIRAIESGLVNIIAHPTGRLIGYRPPYEMDMEKVVKAAKTHNVALELNSFPERLDLSDVHCRLAKEHGVPVVISTDAHSEHDFANIVYGVHTARRGWLEKNDVLNARPLVELKKFLAKGG
ncbi:MAG: DNA polymerase/3'-5' exonuclease PolX [Deltaproteobacteria bacterium]|nr:DNA polymerase/3'-5' exonuclease PolX [Deltaproteobacteria bacterium]